MLIDFKEAARYLGYRQNEPDATVLELMEECADAVQKESEPKHIYRRFALEITDNVIKAGGLEMTSRNLSRNLTGCGEIIFFAATLGNGPDMPLFQTFDKQGGSPAGSRGGGDRGLLQRVPAQY